MRGRFAKIQLRRVFRAERIATEMRRVEIPLEDLRAPEMRRDLRGKDSFAQRAAEVSGAHPDAAQEFEAKVLRDRKTLACLRPRVAFRDVSRATDSRTVRVALVPPKVFITNKGPYLLWPRGDARDEAYVLGVLSTLPLDWYARRFVEVSVNFFIFNPMPIPRTPADHPLRQRTIALAGRLGASDGRFDGWAKDVGVTCGELPPDEKDDLITQLDAVVARLYGLTEKQLAHIFETFHEGWDYDARLRQTLKHFRATKGA